MTKETTNLADFSLSQHYVTIAIGSDISHSIVKKYEDNPQYRLVGTSRTTVMFERVTHDCNTGSQ